MDEKAFEFVLKGGHVIDPKNGLSKLADVAVAKGRIATVAENIPAANAERVVDVSGAYVTPGLIDMHVHMDRSCLRYGLIADAHSFSSGVTTFVDAGTSGATTFGRFKELVIDPSITRVLAFLNIVDLGMGGDWEQDVSRMNPEITAGVAAAYPDIIVGIKFAHYWPTQPYDAEHQTWDAVDRAVAAGEICQLPVMADFKPRPPERSYADLILKKLRPGDMHTHVFGRYFPIIKEDGTVNEIMFQAQKRGVIFDVGHGAGSFMFRNAVRAVKQGFIPNSISTDLHKQNAATGVVTNLLNVMSKFLNMGLSLDDVVMRTTVAPAREIGHTELGTLDVGAEADIAVLKLLKGEFGFIDVGRTRMSGDQKLECLLTLRAGKVVFDPNGLSMPNWKDAPSPYWSTERPA